MPLKTFVRVALSSFRLKIGLTFSLREKGRDKSVYDIRFALNSARRLKAAPKQLSCRPSSVDAVVEVEIVATNLFVCCCFFCVLTFFVDILLCDEGQIVGCDSRPTPRWSVELPILRQSQILV